jgi:hypothetical protein
MTTQITLQDLIDSLRKAAANPEAHASAQQHYFSELKEDSVLVNCGSACCVAGDLMLKAYADASEAKIQRIFSLHQYGYEITPGNWVSKELGLSYVESVLAFDSSTHHEIHSLLADLLESGLRLPDVDRLSICRDSFYTWLDWARLEYAGKYMDLEELKDWMRSIAK